MTKTVKRVIIPEEIVFHVWECPECDDSVEVDPGFYCENGEPFCGECDCDMEYIRTEIDVSKLPRE